MSAAMTPGTQPQRVSRNTINTDPHPLSITASGGNIIANKTCKQLIPSVLVFIVRFRSARNLRAKVQLFSDIRKSVTHFCAILLRVFVLFRSAFLRWLPCPLNYGKTVLASNHITIILTIAGV